MKARLTSFVLAFFAVSTGQSALAAPSAYYCTILSISGPPGGEVVTENLGSSTVGTFMSIDRVTGRTLHPAIGSSGYRETEVLDPGGPEWSFRVLSSSGKIADDGSLSDGGHVHYVEVHEFKDGEEKPFLLVSDGRAYFGTCK